MVAGELQPDKFFQWIRDVTQDQGPDILRLKGILALKGDEQRYVIQGVHMIVEGDHQRPWRDDEARVSKLVFIGRNLDPELIRGGFEATRAK